MEVAVHELRYVKESKQLLEQLDLNLGAMLLIRFSIQALLDYCMDQHLLVALTEESHEVTEVR